MTQIQQRIPARSFGPCARTLLLACLIILVGGVGVSRAGRGVRRAVVASVHGPDAQRHRRQHARRQGSLRLPGMVQHARRRDAFRFQSLGQRAWIGPAADGSPSTCGPTFRSTTRAILCDVAGPQDARRLAGPALQRLPQRAGAAALQVDAAVWHRRRLPEPVRRRDDQPARTRHVNMVLANVREGLPSRGTRLGADARPLDGTNGTDGDRHERLEVSLRPGQGPRRFALPAPSGQARRAALGAWDSRTGPGRREQGAELVELLQERPEVRRRLPDRRHRPLWRTLRGRLPHGPRLGRVYRSVRRHQPLGRRPIPRRRQHGPHPQGGLGRATWPSSKRLGMGYMPTAFPGFSWDNMHRASARDDQDRRAARASSTGGSSPSSRSWESARSSSACSTRSTKGRRSTRSPTKSPWGNTS